jgi:hypothetical protein
VQYLVGKERSECHPDKKEQERKSIPDPISEWHRLAVLSQLDLVSHPTNPLHRGGE